MLEEIRSKWKDIIEFMKSEFEITDVCFKAWIKKEILNNGGVDNFIKCLSDGTIEYIGSDEIMKYIGNNIVEIREDKGGEYDWIITNISTGEKVLIGIL